MPRHLRTRLLLATLLASISVPAMASEAPADHWPRFRGPNGLDLAQGDIPARWTDANKLWTVRLPGTGHGSPAVWGNRVFLLCGNESTGERTPMCLDAATGSVLWQVPSEAMVHKHHKFNSFASTTPAVDADHVYFTWGTPERITVAAFTHDGKPVWQAGPGSVKRDQGFACSPVVHGDLVFLSNDQERDCALYALDRKTGETRWTLPRDENHSNYSTPCIYEPKGGPTQVIVSSWRLGVTGVEAASGKQLWQNSVFAQQKSERAIGSPIAVGDLVIANCAFVNGPKHVVALRPGKGGMEEAWRVEKSVPHIPTIIAVGDRAYLWSDQGIVTCVKLQSGEIIWQERVPGEYFGSPVHVGGKLFAVDKQGSVTVIAAADKLELLAQNPLGGLCQSTPAVAGGRMFIRTWDKLYAIGKATP